MRELLTCAALLLIAFAVAIHACAGPKSVQETITALVERSEAMPTPEPIEVTEIAPGMNFVPGVNPSGVVNGSYACLVPTDSPSTKRPWTMGLLFPAKGGQRYLLVSSRNEPHDVLPGYKLQGPTEWVWALPGTDTKESFTLHFPEEWAGSQWWVQLLWWDGAETLSLSGGWWFRIGNV